jgi:hypothetical protein
VSTFQYTRDEDFRRQFERTNLAAVTGVTPELLLGVVYRGFPANIYGPTGSAKTLIVQGLALEAIRAGLKVAHWDEEMGAELITARYRQMGATDLELARIAFYAWQAPAMDDADAFVDEILSDRPDLVVLDPTADFLGAAGVDENVNAEVTAWAAAFPQRLAQEGVATIMVDAIPHGGSHQRGASQKGYKSRLLWRVEVRDEPSKEHVGLITLTCEKDTVGDVGKGASLAFAVGGTPDGRLIVERRDALRGESADDQLERERREWVTTVTAIVQAYAPRREKAVSLRQLLDLLPAGKRRSFLVDAIKLAAAPGRAVRQDVGGSRGSIAYWYEEPL